MKKKYIMMSMLIQGPKQPGNDIDIYFKLLVDELQTLWKHGVKVYDTYRKEEFDLRAMLFCTVHDYPAFGNTSGQIMKGAKACVTCMDRTASQWLPTRAKLSTCGIVGSYRKITHTG
jgi:hypothetical protein